MKTKISVLFIYSIISLFMVNAQDTLAGWTFPAGSVDEVADFFNTANQGCKLKTENPNRLFSYVTGFDGGSDQCAQTINWNEGNGTKYWLIDINTQNYTQIKLSFIQRSCPMHHGPRDFKVQYKLFGQSNWTDINGGMVTDTANWTKGAVKDLALPSECENQMHTVSLRWVMTSNMNVSGGVVDSNGMSRIDNIFITGTSVLGLSNNRISKNYSIFPNPVKNILTIDSWEISQSNPVLVTIIDNAGKQVMMYGLVARMNPLNLESLSPGIYRIKLEYRNEIYYSTFMKE